MVLLSGVCYGCVAIYNLSNAIFRLFYPTVRRGGQSGSSKKSDPQSWPSAFFYGLLMYIAFVVMLAKSNSEIQAWDFQNRKILIDRTVRNYSRDLMASLPSQPRLPDDNIIMNSRNSHQIAIIPRPPPGNNHPHLKIIGLGKSSLRMVREILQNVGNFFQQKIAPLKQVFRPKLKIQGQVEPQVFILSNEEENINKNNYNCGITPAVFGVAYHISDSKVKSKIHNVNSKCFRINEVLESSVLQNNETLTRMAETTNTTIDAKFVFKYLEAVDWVENYNGKR